MNRDRTPDRALRLDGVRPFLASTWSELLGVRSLTDHSHFRACGGDSLLGLRLARRINREYGVAVAPRDLLCRTLGEQVALVEGLLGGPSVPSVPSAGPARSRGAARDGRGPGEHPNAPAPPAPSASGQRGPDVRRFLAAAWRVLLRLPEAELADDADFLALGGDCLLASRLSCRIGRRFGIAVPVRDLLARPALGDQAALVKALSARASAA